MMRLAWLCTDPGIPFGGSKGASVHLGELVAAAAAEGAETLLLVRRVHEDAAVPDGVRVETLSRPDPSAASQTLVPQDDSVDWLIDRLERFRPVALYERLALNSDAGARAARALGIPHLVELNAPLPEEAARYRALEDRDGALATEASVLRSADLVLAVSGPLAERAAALGARRVEVLQNAADVSRYGSPRPSVSVPTAVFAGSLRPWHGVETIASAWQRLGASAPPLLVVGDGPARDLLDGIPARLVGSVAPARVPQLLAQAEIGLAPYGPDSPRYFSPLKLFEYLAAGLATIVGDLPAVTEIVDRDTAIVIPAGDAAALADAVATLCADAAERRRLGRNGRALVEASHTWTHRARRILEAASEIASLPSAQADPSGVRIAQTAGTP